MMTAQQPAIIITIMVLELHMPHQGVAMRTAILTPSALLLVALASGCNTPVAAAVERSIDDPAPGVAGNCPVGAGPMRPAGAGAAADHNHDGYSCVRGGISITGDSMRFEVDNDASNAGPAAQRDPVWDALYTGM